MKHKNFIPLLAALLMPLLMFGQNQGKDKSVFKEYEPGYYQNSILKDVRAVEKMQSTKKMDKRFIMDHSMMELPNNVELYEQQWHNPVISQGNTGSCWCFSTTSFFETEIERLSGQKIKLSEMFTVYWEYVEKARGFVQSRGKTIFEQGSEGNAVTRSFKQNGIVPWNVYTGLTEGRKHHTHEAMYNEMLDYLKSVKRDNAWNEEVVVETIKAIMNHHIGEPPAHFDWNGTMMNPKMFLENVCKLNMDDYIEILSIMQQPYWTQVEYEVPDNWWASEDYYNVPLDVFMDIVKTSIRNGYTCSIGGDVSEAGFNRGSQVALVPDFDIPSEYINEEARQFRFSNETTTDDHGMHLVGWLNQDGKDFYLIKDSSSGSRNNDENAKEFGYYFFSEDYVKLKMMGFTIHKDAVPQKYLKKLLIK